MASISGESNLPKALRKQKQKPDSCKLPGINKKPMNPIYFSDYHTPKTFVCPAEMHESKYKCRLK